MGDQNISPFKSRKNLPTTIILAAYSFPLLVFVSVLSISVTADIAVDIGDILEIEVQGEPSLSVTCEVDESGFISYPFLQRVDAQGKSPSALARHIEKRLYDEEFLWEPRVSVKITDRPGYVVCVSGQVNDPGSSPLEKGMRIRDALSTHKGIIEDRAGPDIVLRGRKRPSAIRIDRELLFSKGLAGKLLNFTLKAGDEIIVPTAGEFTLEGAVEKPGRRSLTKRLTLSEILQQSGGPKKDVSARVILRREGENGPREWICDLGEIRRGRKMLDYLAHEGDIITVLATGFFYVGGELEHSGVSKWNDAVTLAQILNNEIPQKKLDGKRIEITRWDKSQSLRYNPHEILLDDSKDVPIMDRDIILFFAD